MDKIAENQQLEIFDLLNVNLKIFEGPLELLLDLIRKKKMDIQEIPLAEICAPYLKYLDMMEEFNMEIAIEFLDIASTLILIKSRSLLPRKADEEELEEGLNTEEQLRKKLLEYQKYKNISAALSERDLLGSELFCRPETIEKDPEEILMEFEDLTVYSLIKSYHNMLKRKGYQKSHEISSEQYSLEHKILEFLKIFQTGEIQSFHNICPKKPSSAEVIISFLAILELCRRCLLELHQMQEFGPVHCKPIENIADYIPVFKEQIPFAS